MPFFTSASARSVAWVKPSSTPARQRSRVERHARQRQPQHRERRPSSSGPVSSSAGAVLLQVAVVAAGQALHRGEQAHQVAHRPAALAADQLEDVGVLLLRHHRAAQAMSPESEAKPNSAVVKSMRSVDSRLACTKKRAVA